MIILAFIGQGGGRRIIGVMLLSAMATWLISRSRIKLSHLILSTAMLGGLLVALQALLFIRSTGFRDNGFSAISVAIDSIFGEKRGAYDHLHVDDNFYRLCQITDIIPDHHPYVYHKYIWWVSVRPIPRILWPGKPLNGGFNLTEQVGAQASLSSSIVGELFLSWGLLAVAAGGFIYGRLATLPSLLLRAERTSLGPLIYGYLTMILLVGARSMIEVVLFSYSIILLTVAYNLNQTAKFGKKTSQVPGRPQGQGIGK